MKSFAISLFLVALFSLSEQLGYACYCAVPEAPEAFARAGAVFVGQVVEITEPTTTNADAPLPGRFFVIKFKVERSWKGAPFSGQVRVLSGQGRYGCFSHPPVSIGERHLIYADLHNGWLSIWSCSRTALLTDPIKPGPLQPVVAYPKSGKVNLSAALTPSGIDAATDLRLLESMLFPTFNFNYRMGRGTEQPAFPLFMEPGLKILDH